MIQQFARDPGLSSGMASEKPTYVPDMQQLTQALNTFDSILREQKRSVTPDITLIELGSSGVTDQTLASNSAVELAPIPERGLATSTITPINMDINVTLEPNLGMLVLSKDGFNETFKVDCQFINWPKDSAAFAHLDEAPTESTTPIDPLPTPEPKVIVPVLPTSQYIVFRDLVDRAVISFLPETLAIDAYHSQSPNTRIELYINGNFISSQAGVSTGGTYTFRTNPTADYDYYVKNIDGLTKGSFLYYAVLIGDAGTVSSASSSIKLAARFYVPKENTVGGGGSWDDKNIITVSSSATGAHGVAGASQNHIPISIGGWLWMGEGWFGPSVNQITAPTSNGTGIALTGYPESVPHGALSRPATTTWTYNPPGTRVSTNLTFSPDFSLTEGDNLYITNSTGVAVPGSPFSGTLLAGATVNIAGSTSILTLVTIPVPLIYDANIEEWVPDPRLAGWGNDYGFLVTDVNASLLEPDAIYERVAIRDEDGIIIGYENQIVGYLGGRGIL